MKSLIFILLNLPLLLSQDIFDSFELEGKNRYVGKTTYEFDISDITPENRTLEIIILNGDIEVEGKPGSSVTIIERMTVKSSSERKAKDVFNKNRATVTVNTPGHIIMEGKNRLQVPKTWYNYAITVPSKYNIRAKTSGGDISLSYIAGELFMRTSGGDISAKRAQGKITGKTSGGDIFLKDIKGLANVKTSGGDIEFSDCEGKLEGTTSGGDIEAEYCRGGLSVFTSGGSIELKGISGPEIHGRTSGGDLDIVDIHGNLNISTSGGTIEIEKVTGSVDAETSGGDINLTNINGGVDVTTSSGDITGSNLSGSVVANTSHGDIEIEKNVNPSLENHNITLKTSDGDISLTLPGDFSSRIDAVVKDRRSTGAIDSEFPLNIFLYQNEVHGEGTFLKGTHSVKLRTKYRSIIIEKD